METSYKDDGVCKKMIGVWERERGGGVRGREWEEGGKDGETRQDITDITMNTACIKLKYASKILCCLKERYFITLDS